MNIKPRILLVVVNKYQWCERDRGLLSVVIEIKSVKVGNGETYYENMYIHGNGFSCGDNSYT